MIAALALFAPATAVADTTPLTQGFEHGLGDWQVTAAQPGSGWQVLDHPENVAVTIDPKLVTLGGPQCATGGPCLPAAATGSGAAWFGDPSNGTYCSPIAAQQHPEDGCTSTGAVSGELTSPSFSLAGTATAQLDFNAWWEIEAVNADVADQMSVWYWTPALGWKQATVWPAGDPAAASLVLNPTDPSWGGVHQAYSDDGARMSGQWAPWVADLSAAAGSPEVKVAFAFNTVDERRNGFRGWLVDDIAVVNALGAPVTDDTTTFPDSVPSLSITDMSAQPGDGGTWNIDFTVHQSHPTHDPTGANWTINDSRGNAVGHGSVTIPGGQTDTTVQTTVAGGGQPYTATLSDPTGATIDPLLGTAAAAGPTLPTISLGAPSSAPTADPGLVAVTIPVSLDAPATFPVSVDYTVNGGTGGSGAAIATGTITIPAGSTTASATPFVPLDSLPATVTLSNPVNAVLATGATNAAVGVPGSATSSSTGGAGAGGSGGAGGAGSTGSGGATDTGSQLILGVRINGSCPCLGKNFLLTYISGTIRYHRPGEAYKALTSGSVLLPFGTVVDTTNGHARVTVDSDGHGTLQSGEFWSGMFGVFQTAGPLPVAELALAGGDYSVCPGASRFRSAKGSATKVIRQLWGNAKGRFRTKGRFAAATVRGTEWLTEDLCLETRVTVQEGIVAVFDFRRKTTTAVPAGQSITVGALQSARYHKRTGRNRSRLSRVLHP